MDDKLKHLRKYNQEIRLLTHEDISSIAINQLPDDWYDIFKEQDSTVRIKRILGIWKEYLRIELRNTISYLSEFLVDVELMQSGEDFSVLYTIKNSKGNILYYEGRNPQDQFNNNELREVWEKMPNLIQKFYEEVHNGFYYYASESMGLVPIKSVTFLGDEDLEWGIIDELEEPIGINLESSFGFFTNGMGTYIVIDYQNCNNNNATFWSSKRQPNYNINFWSYVDEWIVIGFE
ncbi:SMI1/KNR4 family protein [Paenibacillus sp. FSL H8-0317]|uniref:SMI1/KNR4 family protein n=1 Tax=unclassified Paenibacillus TaxID=185978 RepID=UPI0030D11795